MNDATKIWLEEADNNKYSCEVLIAQHKPPYRIIAYLASMSAEMAIKACYTELMPHKEIPRIHKTTDLLKDISEYISVPIDITHAAELLIPNTVHNKYPDGEEMGIAEILNVIKLSKDIYSWASKCIQEHEQLNIRARKPCQIPDKQSSKSIQSKNLER